MRILLTGHNGYIGSVMAPILRTAGHDVVGCDTYFYGDCTLGDETSEKLPVLKKDIRDLVEEDLKGFDAVVHLAALSNDPLGDLDSDWTYDINHLGSVHLAQLAQKTGVTRFIYASSCSMYGASGGDDLLDENAALKPITPYAISKVRTEEDLDKLADSGFSPVYMRNATAYGASARLRADVVLNNLICWAVTTGKVRILSDGTPWRPIVHIQDISYACAALLEAPIHVVHNQAFNIGINGENYQVRDLAEIVEKVVPDCSVEYGGKSEPDPRNYRVDFSKFAHMVPQFKSRWDARKGAVELYQALKAVNFTWDDFQDRKYVRLRQLRYLIDSGQLDGRLRWITH